MKYAVIIHYFNGTTAGYTVKAESAADAWDKLRSALHMTHIQAVELAEMLTADAEIK